jgi:hypothetical protein
MRYFLDLSEADMAMAMGCSVGWVTSQRSRALARLRAHPALQGLDLGEHVNDFEDRLASLLRQAAPEPAAVIDPSTVRRGARRRPTGARWDGRWRWAAPALALVVVLAASASGCAVPRLHAAPAAGSAAPLPVEVSCPATAVTVDQQRAAATGASAVPSGLMLEPKEIASSATAAHASRDGMVSLIVNPDGQPQWRVMGVGVRLPDQASARNYAILLMQLHGCGSHQKEIEPVGSASMPTTRFFHKTYDGGEPGGGDRYIVALVGTDVLDYLVTGPNSNAAGPGDAFLVSLAAAARAKDQGQTVPPVAHPIVVPDPVRPAGFLTTAQLGAGWANGNQLGDGGPITRANVGVSFCAAPTTDAIGSGRIFTYRHSTAGNEDNVLFEQILTLTPARVQKVRAALAAAPSTCMDSTVLFTNTPGTGDASVALRPATMTGWATVYMLTGDTYIVLTALPGGAGGATTPLPGGITWLSHVAEASVANLTR